MIRMHRLITGSRNTNLSLMHRIMAARVLREVDNPEDARIDDDEFFILGAAGSRLRYDDPGSWAAQILSAVDPDGVVHEGAHWVPAHSRLVGRDTHEFPPGIDDIHILELNRIRDLVWRSMVIGKGEGPRDVQYLSVPVPLAFQEWVPRSFSSTSLNSLNFRGRENGNPAHVGWLMDKPYLDEIVEHNQDPGPTGGERTCLASGFTFGDDAIPRQAWATGQTGGPILNLPSSGGRVAPLLGQGFFTGTGDDREFTHEVSMTDMAMLFKCFATSKIPASIIHGGLACRVIAEETNPDNVPGSVKHFVDKPDTMVVVPLLETLDGEPSFFIPMERGALAPVMHFTEELDAIIPVAVDSTGRVAFSIPTGRNLRSINGHHPEFRHINQVR